jgi:hypothetical protein
MQKLEQSASTIEENYQAFVSGASRFNNNFIYQYPAEHHAEIPAEIPERCHAPGDDDESVHPDRVPMETPGTDRKFFAMDTEEDLYKEYKKLHTVLRKLDNFLRLQHPELLRTMQKMSLFDVTASDPDMESGSSHPTSTRTPNTTAWNASGTLL